MSNSDNQNRGSDTNSSFGQEDDTGTSSYSTAGYGESSSGNDNGGAGSSASRQGAKKAKRGLSGGSDSRGESTDDQGMTEAGGEDMYGESDDLDTDDIE